MTCLLLVWGYLIEAFLHRGSYGLLEGNGGIVLPPVEAAEVFAVYKSQHGVDIHGAVKEEISV